MHDLKLVGLAGMASAVIAGLFYLLLLWIDGGLVDHDVRLAFTLVVFCSGLLVSFDRTQFWENICVGEKN